MSSSARAGLQWAACGRQSQLHGLASLPQHKAPFHRAASLPRRGTRDATGLEVTAANRTGVHQQVTLSVSHLAPAAQGALGAAPEAGTAALTGPPGQGHSARHGVPWAGRSLTHLHGLTPTTLCLLSTALCVQMESRGAEKSTRSVLLLLVAG